MSTQKFIPSDTDIHILPTFAIKNCVHIASLSDPLRHFLQI